MAYSLSVPQWFSPEVLEGVGSSEGGRVGRSTVWEGLIGRVWRDCVNNW